MAMCIYISPHCDLYGAEKSMLSIIREMKRNGKKVLVVIPRKGKLCKELEKENIEYKVIKFANNVNYLGKTRLVYGMVKLAFNMFQCIRMKYELRNETIEFVHTNSIVTDFGAQLSAILGCRHFQHIREFGKKDFNMTFELGNNVLYRLHKKDAAIICISQAVRKEYEKIFKSRVHQIYVVYNGLPCNSIKAVGKETSKNETFRIVMVGRLSEEKGQIDAINAIKILTKLGISVCLDMYGDGAERQNIEDYIVSEGLSDNIRLMGYSAEIVYSDYDAAVICSRCEAFGRVTVEYMLNGLPVVGANSGATTEIIINGITGYVYEARNSEDLSEKILKLINREDKGYKMGESGRQRALELFNESKYTNRIMELYSNCRM